MSRKHELPAKKESRRAIVISTELPSPLGRGNALQLSLLNCNTKSPPKYFDDFRRLMAKERR